MLGLGCMLLAPIPYSLWTSNCPTREPPPRLLLALGPGHSFCTCFLPGLLPMPSGSLCTCLVFVLTTNGIRRIARMRARVLVCLGHRGVPLCLEQPGTQGLVGSQDVTRIPPGPSSLPLPITVGETETEQGEMSCLKGHREVRRESHDNIVGGAFIEHLLHTRHCGSHAFPL